MNNAELNKAVSAAIALRQIELSGKACGIDLTMRDRIVMAEHINTLRNVLQELVDLVRGECPSLLDEDSGGNARLSIEIDECLTTR